jgi:hypothetical protein
MDGEIRRTISIFDHRITQNRRMRQLRSPPDSRAVEWLQIAIRDQIAAPPEPQLFGTGSRKRLEGLQKLMCTRTCRCTAVRGRGTVHSGFRH